ncbi:MAG: ribonuclease HII [Nitrospirota bacterium]
MSYTCSKEICLVAENHRLEKLWKYEEEVFSSGYELIGGIDEVGRGPLAGPVVAAVAILPRDAKIPGINDSKKLSPLQRERLCKTISKTIIDWGIGIVDEQIIDEINILQATYLAMKKAIKSLKSKPHFLLVDGLKIPHLDIPQKPIIKGDQLSISIAAASILAKVIRDRMMIEYDNEFPHYGFAKHKGYGTDLHIEAIKKYGVCKIHRRSFEPIKSMCR